MLIEALKVLSQVLNMLFVVKAVNQKTIYVGIGERKFPNDTVNKTLEGLSGVSQPRRHAQIFEDAKRRDDSRLGNVTGLDGNLMVGFNQVYLENTCEPYREVVKSEMYGSGYQSGTVALFRAL